MAQKNQSGFTLYELMIVLLIVGVVLSYGIPNMTEFRQNGRMTSTANDLHSSFHLARSEAARSKTNITICASANSMADAPTCGGEFEAGWIVFEDNDGDIAVDGGEAILHRFPPTHDSIIIKTTGPDDYFSFAPTGLGRGNITGTEPVASIVICDVRGNVTAAGGSSAARVLVVTPLGRATVLRETEQITFHGGC